MIRSRARFYCALSLPRPAETRFTREDGNFHPRTIPTGKPWPNGQAVKSRYHLGSSDDNREQRASSFVCGDFAASLTMHYGDGSFIRRRPANLDSENLAHLSALPVC